MVIICPCCGVKLEIYIQTYPAKYNRPDRVMVTCETPTCPTVGRTLNETEHAALCAEHLKSAS